MVVSTNYNFDTTIKIYDERKSSPQRCGDQVGLFRKREEMSLHTLTVTNEAIIEAYGVVLMNGGIEDPEALNQLEVHTIKKEIKTRDTHKVEMLCPVWLHNRIEQLRDAGRLPVHG